MAIIAPPPTGRTSYDPIYFGRLFAIEDEHFWFRARNAVIGAVIGRLVGGLPDGYRVLEVGCGTGNVLHALQRTCLRGRVFGMDLFAEGLRLARGRTTCPLIRGDVHTPPFGSRFDVVGLFDVLEHLPDDTQVLRDLRALLPTGGVLVLTVPAHTALWSYFDEASHHCRRYEPAALAEKLRAAGYRVEYLTHAMMPLYPLIWGGRRIAQRLGRARRGGLSAADANAINELRVVPVVNGLLSRLLAPEAWLIGRRTRLPVGTSLLAVARKVGE